MYKYLSIVDDVLEMMIMLKSLPACTLVFDINMKLVDANQQALNKLKIQCIDDFSNKGCAMFIDPVLFKDLMLDMKRGKMVRSAKMLLKCADGSLILAEFSACMINAKCDLFIFQFFEVSQLNTEDSIFLRTNSFLADIYSTYCKQDILIKKPESDPNDTIEMMNVKDQKCVEKEQNQLKENITQLRVKKQRGLSEIEIVVSNLLETGLSVKEISDRINKSISTVYTITRRLVERNIIESGMKLAEN
jgi:DNA-binding CsgD family transcriptional regulator